MIKKIIIDDFQSWEHLELEPSPHLSVIVGTSNQGKTGIARALSACIYGEWDTSWVRFGKPFCKITVTLDNGVSVTRRKGPKVNEYVLKIPNSEDQVFSSIGVGVPEPIQRAFNMYKVPILNGETINFGYASQLDPLFMLAGSKSFNAKILGKLTGADVLDSAIQSLNKDKRQTTAERGSKELEVVELQDQIDKLAPIEAFSKDICNIEARLASLATLEARLQAIRSLFERVKVLKANWVRETAKADLLGPLDLVSIGQISNRVEVFKKLSLLLGKFTEFQAVCEHQDKLQALLTQVDLALIAKLEPKVNRVKKLVTLSSKYNAWQGMYSAQSRINNLLTPVDISVIPVLAEKASDLKKIKDLSVRIGKNQKELLGKTEELGRVEQQYQEAKEQYSEMLKANGTCPTCNQSTVNV